jgi:hypothetical protein
VPHRGFSNPTNPASTVHRVYRHTVERYGGSGGKTRRWKGGGKGSFHRLSRLKSSVHLLILVVLQRDSSNVMLRGLHRMLKAVLAQ